MKWLAWPCIGPRPAFWKKSYQSCQSLGPLYELRAGPSQTQLLVS